MSRIPLARRAVILLLILAVAAPLAAAPVQRSGQVRFEAATPLASLWSWLARAWAKNGCLIDPHGRCLPGTGAAPAPPASTDNGCGLDPGGRCQPAASPLPAADNGCGLDPWGRCGS
ncbi:MAG: hypothetical protein QOF89_5187 [Acidobacteriota bacterium]|jgi:hypothetical protein|nr:hypothetical protein [Acidobacteriota bacterium]